MVFEKTLTAMVKGIRANRGKETEYIHSCIQEIQKEVVSANVATKSMAVLKLAYLNMLGYDMSWAAFQMVEVMSHNKFTTRRPGYLASALCFGPSTDVGLLTINLFKKDFGSKSQYETGMALTCLSSICSPEICRDIIGDLSSMLSSSRPYIRKKTMLCLFRIFVRDPQALRTCFPKLKERLGDEDQGVLTATVNTFLELARKNAKNYLSLVPQLYHILVNTTNNWLTIKLLKLFQLLVPLEPRLPSKMNEPLTNLLNTTKAQSVEYEAIRCTIRTMPDGSPLMTLALEKLQTFLNSSDRNLRFLSLQLFKEVLERPNINTDKLAMSEVAEKVLESIEESDSTARNVSLNLLDLIATPATFQDTGRKLIDFSKKSSQPDEFLGTLLRMGARDRYALLEDFAWYLLVLAEISANVDSIYGDQIAEQMIDISVRVEAVRPYAVTMALTLLDRASSVVAVTGTDAESGDAAPVGVAPPVIGACAFILGEYHGSFDSPSEQLFVKAAKALLSRHVQSLEPAIQTQCVWAAMKLYLGAPRHAVDAVAELHELLVEKLPFFLQSTQVDVAERAALSLHLVNHFKGDAASVGAGAGLLEEPLLPVRADAQAAVEVPSGVDLDEPFFKVEAAIEKIVYQPIRSDPTDPYQLAASYKDDLGFLAASDAQQQVAQVGASSGASSSMFYLKGQSAGLPGAENPGDAETSGVTADAKPVALDPLEQMRQKLAAAQAGGGMKYQVLRDDIQAPAGNPAAAAAPSPAMPAPAVATLPIPQEKELTELQGRLWAMCYKDENLALHACIRSKNMKKQLLRVDLRCERIAKDGDPITSVSLKLPAGVSATEADASGVLSLVPGELEERSAKVKMNLGLAFFVSPGNHVLNCEVNYSRGVAMSGKVDLRLPATSTYVPSIMSADDIAEYMSQRSAELIGVPQVLNLQMEGKAVQDISQALPALVGRCAGLCHFFGIQHTASEKGHKFLLVAQPPLENAAATAAGREALPQGSLIICLCAAMPREGQLDLRITVKSARKDVSEDVGAQLITVFRELIEGRLRTV